MTEYIIFYLRVYVNDFTGVFKYFLAQFYMVFFYIIFRTKKRRVLRRFTALIRALLFFQNKKTTRLFCQVVYLVEISGFEPLASSLRTRRSTN